MNLKVAMVILSLALSMTVGLSDGVSNYKQWASSTPIVLYAMNYVPAKQEKLWITQRRIFGLSKTVMYIIEIADAKKCDASRNWARPV